MKSKYQNPIKSLKERLSIERDVLKKKDKTYKVLVVFFGINGGIIGFLFTSSDVIILKYIWYPLITQIILGFWMIYKGEKTIELLEHKIELIEKQKIIIEKKEKETQEQKHLVEEKQKEILDSIHYAKRLQEAILPPLHFINEHVPNNFVLYQPKDVVAWRFLLV